MYCDSLSDHVVLPSVGKCIAGVGWTGTAVPERFGGVGRCYVDLCVIAEEIGRCVAPVPFSSSVYLAVEAILRGGDEAQKRAWLPKLASGETVGTFALSEGTGPAKAAGLTTQIGRATGRERVFPYVSIRGGTVTLKKTR